MKCKYFDCGWCYAPSDILTNSTSGSCGGADDCVEFAILDLESSNDKDINEPCIAKLRMQAESLFQQGNKDIAKSFNDLITAYEEVKEELDLWRIWKCQKLLIDTTRSK